MIALYFGKWTILDSKCQLNNRIVLCSQNREREQLCCSSSAEAMQLSHKLRAASEHCKLSHSYAAENSLVIFKGVAVLLLYERLRFYNFI